MDDLIAEIDAFLAKTGMTPTALGKGALGDPSFIPNLRKGRRLWPETAAKVRAFMAEHGGADFFDIPESASAGHDSDEVAQ